MNEFIKELLLEYKNRKVGDFYVDDKIYKFAIEEIKNNMENLDKSPEEYVNSEIQYLQNLNKKSQIKLYRLVFSKSKDDINTDDIGIHFVEKSDDFHEQMIDYLIDLASKKDAYEYGYDDGYLLTVIVPTSKIDWENTFLTRIAHPFENEIMLKDGKGLKIEKIEGRDLDENLKTRNKVVVVFPGRFQPFSLHHKQVYDRLVKKFNNVYILTSDKIEYPNSPFSFNEKKKIISSFGISFSKIIKMNNLYNPHIKSELIGNWKKIISEKDFLIVVIGEKDSIRLTGGKYYLRYNEKQPMNEVKNNAYILIDNSYYIFENPITQEKEPLSATYVRNLFKTNKYTESQRKEIFNKLYDSSLYSLFYEKLAKKSEFLTELVHVDDLTPKKLLDLFKQWGINKEKIIITEKPDGRFMKFGIKDGKFFMSSKNNEFYNSQEYPHLFFYEDFIKYHKELEKIDFKKIIEKILSKDINDIIFLGEGIASYDTNVILYDKNIIGGGVFIVFNIIIDNEKIDDDKQKQIITEINKHTQIKFYSKLVVNVKDFDVQKYSLELEDIISQYGNVLNKPARTPQDKQLKEKILDKVKKLSTEFKSDFFTSLKDYSPYLGKEYEGFVVHLPDGTEYKIVDKDKFTKRKMSNWYYMELLNKYNNDFKRKIKTETISDNINDLYKQISNLYEDFKKNSDKHIDIPERKKDTIELFKLSFNIIKKIKKELIKNPHDEDSIRNKILNKSLDESKITEGGHTFPNTSQIKSEYIKNTLDYMFEHVGMKGMKYELIGNYRKPIANDIDIAVDINDIAPIIGYKSQTKILNQNKKDKEMFFSLLRDYLEKHMDKTQVTEYKINTGLQQFSTLSQMIDENGNKIKGQFGQTDVMVGNRSWMTPTLGPVNIKSKYKPAYRNYLFKSALSQIINNTDDPSIKQKFQINMKDGVELVTFTYKNGKRIKLDIKPFTSDVQGLVDILFSPKVSYSDVNSFEELYTMMNSSKFKYKKLLKNIIEDYKKVLIEEKLPIPEELESIKTEQLLFESGIQNINKLAKKKKYFEIYAHQDLDGVMSAIAMKKYLESYGLTLKNIYMIQYGNKEFEIPSPSDPENTVSVLVDFDNGKVGFDIHVDHHNRQMGVEKGTATQFRQSESETETISGIISSTDIFPPEDINYINMIDNADYFKYKVQTFDILRDIFFATKDVQENKKRMLMVVNRLILAYKKKPDFLEIVIKKSDPSILNVYLNVIDIAKTFPEYKNLYHNTIDYERRLRKYPKIKLIKNTIVQYGIPYVGIKGSYDRFTPFRVYPEAKFLIAIYPIIYQISINPFMTRPNINLPDIIHNILLKWKKYLSVRYVGIAKYKRFYAKEAKKTDIDFKYRDLNNLFSGKIRGLNNKNEERIKQLMDKNYSELSEDEKNELNNYKISLWDIIDTAYGGHPTIVNIPDIQFLYEDSLFFTRGITKQILAELKKY